MTTDLLNESAKLTIVDSLFFKIGTLSLEKVPI